MSSNRSWAVRWPHQLSGWLNARYTCDPARTRAAGCWLTLADVLAEPSGSALKQVISCTLLPAPVLPANPKRKELGIGPLDRVIWGCVRIGCQVPPLMR